MYTVKNYKTKKALIQDFKDGVKIEVFQPGPFGGDSSKINQNKAGLEGPHFPEPHRWYAQADIVDGIIVKVK